MPATYEPIATTTLGTTAASITFSTIPATYTDLRIVFTGLDTSGGDWNRIRFNGDTGSNYSATYIDGDGTSATSGRGTSLTGIYGAVISDVHPSLATIDIFSYTGSTNKTVLVSASNDQNGSGVTRHIVGLWQDTSAITSVTLLMNSGNMAAGATATLYGILKA
jgi:hypothetical protein